MDLSVFRQFTPMTIAPRAQPRDVLSFDCPDVTASPSHNPTFIPESLEKRSQTLHELESSSLCPSCHRSYMVITVRAHMATSDCTGLAPVTFSHTFMPSGKTPCERNYPVVVSSPPTSPITVTPQPSLPSNSARPGP
jgi:hypothetical protein